MSGGHHEGAHFIHLAGFRILVRCRADGGWFYSCPSTAWTFAGGAAASSAVFDGESAKSADAGGDADVHLWSVEVEPRRERRSAQENGGRARKQRWRARGRRRWRRAHRWLSHRRPWRESRRGERRGPTAHAIRDRAREFFDAKAKKRERPRN